jgi:SH3 domain
MLCSFACADCPQVQVIRPYAALEPDELDLNQTDVVSVLRKTADGWFIVNVLAGD